MPLGEQPKPETAARRRQREAYEAAAEKAADAAGPLGPETVRRLRRIAAESTARRRGQAIVSDQSADKAQRNRAEAGKAEDGLDQLPATAQSRDAMYFHAIVAAGHLTVAAELALTAAVRAARAAGDSWTVIGAALGVGSATARERYGGSDGA